MKYIKNPDGGIHSVDDDFELPQGWDELSEDEVRQDAPALLGEQPEAEAAPSEPAAPESAPADPPSEVPSEPVQEPEQPVEAPADQAAPVEPQPGGVQ